MPDDPRRNGGHRPTGTGSSPEAEVDDELAFHLDRKAEELERRGVPPDEAHRRARREFGDVDGTRRYMMERQQRVRRKGWWRERVGQTARDLRLAVRSFLRRPLVPAVVVTTLAVGIGANAAVFSLVDALVLRPLPFGDGDRLVRMRDAVERSGRDPWLYNSSPRSYHLLRESGVFRSVTAQRYRPVILTGRGEPTRLTAIGVSRNWLETLRVRPHLGRGFTEGEVARGRDARVALLDHGFWTDRFGASPDILGTTLTLNDEPHTVVGVMPPGFNYPYGADVWVPDRFDPASGRFGPNVAARLRDGATLASTQAELDELSRRAAEAYPETHASVRFVAVPQREDLVGNHTRLALILLGTVAFLLLIACANVAHLLLIRSIDRRREAAVRTALGAGRADHLRHALVEAALLAGAGGALGIGLAHVLVGPLAALSTPPDSSLGSFFTDLAVDGRVLAFTAGLTLLTTLLFGVLPTFRARDRDVAATLRASGRGAGSSKGLRLRQGLVVAEVALSTVLLAGALLLYRDFERLRTTDPGFGVDDRLVVDLALPADADPDPGARSTFLARLEDRLAALPGVRSVGIASHLPVTDGSNSQPVTVEDGPASEPGDLILVNDRLVNAGHRRALGLEVVRGRWMSEVEVRDASPVVVVSRSMARGLWPNEDPVGRRIRAGTRESDTPWLEVVGVVADAREEWELDETWYRPYTRSSLERLHLVLHPARADGELPALVREAVWSLDPDQPVTRIASLERRMAETLASERRGTALVAAFAGVGLFLVVLGLYGVVGYAVRTRTREVGIRLALGAERGAVRRMITFDGVKLVGLGLAVGLPVALMLTRGLGGFLAGAGPVEVRTLAGDTTLGVWGWGGVLAVLAAAGLLACWGPARRAAAMEPAHVLREE